jgi:hypothetical protein
LEGWLKKEIEYAKSEQSMLKEAVRTVRNSKVEKTRLMNRTWAAHQRSRHRVSGEATIVMPCRLRLIKPRRTKRKNLPCNCGSILDVLAFLT